MMAKTIFVNLPVTDLARSIAFYGALGAARDSQFSDETAAMMTFSDAIKVMLISHDKYRQFTDKPIADAHGSSQVILCLSAENREAVDAMVAKAASVGGVSDPAKVQDLGFCYGRDFEDPDGHHWEVMWMDMAALGASQESGAPAGEAPAADADAVQAADRAA